MATILPIITQITRPYMITTLPMTLSSLYHIWHPAYPAIVVIPVFSSHLYLPAYQIKHDIESYLPGLDTTQLPCKLIMNHPWHDHHYCYALPDRSLSFCLPWCVYYLSINRVVPGHPVSLDIVVSSMTCEYPCHVYGPFMVVNYLIFRSVSPWQCFMKCS